MLQEIRVKNLNMIRAKKFSHSWTCDINGIAMDCLDKITKIELNIEDSRLFMRKAKIELGTCNMMYFLKKLNPEYYNVYNLF